MWLVGLNFIRTVSYVASWFEFLKTDYMIYLKKRNYILSADLSIV